MVICPVAIAIGCKKCPVFKVCPMTTIIGDQKAPDSPQKSAEKDKAPAKKKS